MKTKPTVFVTGITGNQGKAVAVNLLKNKFPVIGLTRNPDSQYAKQMENKGATIVKGNLNEPETYKAYLDKADAVFLVQALQGKQNEIQQGKMFIDSIDREKNSHLVYASVLGADLHTGVPHFESKYELENYIKSKGLIHTILRPASFYENHLMPQVYNNIKKGKYISPLKSSCVQQMIGVDDIGKMAAHVIANRSGYVGKTLSIATDQYKIGDVPAVFSEVLKQPVKYSRLPGLVTRLFMGKDLYKMFKYMNENNFEVVENIDAIKNEFGIEGNFKSWVIETFRK